MSSALEPAAQRRARIRPLVVALLTAALVVAGLLAPTSSPPAEAADLSNFKAGNIISDSVFFHKDSMTQAQIQSFLNSKESGCQSGYTCLKSYKTATRTIAKGAMCNGYTASKSETAAAIIFKVARSCGINPQVFLVAAQKEQGLVTSTKPSARQFNYAMGANCPDSTGCNGNSSGFFTQMYAFGWQMKRYANPSGTSKYFTWYPVGKTSKIAYSPRSTGDADSPCGFASVTIANQATADLYYYTPYVPNAAALKAGYGTGDSCSSYGNRNFYNYFVDWFGSTQVQAFTTKPVPTITGTAKPGQILTAHAGTWSPAPSKISYQGLRGGPAVSGTTESTYRVTNSDAGKTLSVKVTAGRLYYTSVSQTSKATATIKAIPTTRLSGSDAVERSVAASKAAHSGTVSAVYLVGSDAPEDSLSAAARTTAIGGGILVVPKNSMPSSTSAELKRLAPSTVVLLGTTSTLDSGTASRVQAVLPKASVSRIDDADRYARSLSVAARYTSAPTVYLATGRAFPDAISAAAVAGAQKAPMIVVDGTATKASAALLSRLKTLKTTKAIVMGGPLAVSDGIVSSLTKAGISVSRSSGATLYETNAALMSATYTGTASRVVAASAAVYADAPSAAALAGALGAPLLMSGSTCVPATMSSFLAKHSTTAVTLVGDTTALGADVARLKRC